VRDEITMEHKSGVEPLNTYNKRLMCGVTVLRAGDFRQTLPLVPKGIRTDKFSKVMS
jgi:hypothetical protein